MAGSLMPTPEPAVDVAGLGRRFGDHLVIEGVTLRIGAGEIVGLVGANGGGKTTTLRMLAGLLKPTKGGGRVLGRDVMRPEAAARQRIGYMAQALALYPELTVAENLRFRADVLCGDGARAAIAIERHGLAEVAASRIAELSGGWARRVQFAASVIHAPDLLLLDEPTAGLDVRTRRDLWQWIGEQASRGCAVLVSTHDLHEAEQCPLILHYRGGQVEGPLAPRQFLARSGSPSLEAAVLAESGV